MINNPWYVFHGKRVLLLQGPVGPFFRHLSRLLEGVGARVNKVNFNGGDCLFYPQRALLWRGALHDWPEYFSLLLCNLKIDIVVLFGDCRPMHCMAREIATRSGVRVFAFEEGYVRPNFITFEQFGVNGYSQVIRKPSFVKGLPLTPALPEEEVGRTFWWAALWAVLYYLAAAFMRPLFRHYRHHRPLRLTQGWYWLRSGWRKMLYGYKERGVLRLLTGGLSKKFFLVPLQIQCDAQVYQHSDFRSVIRFLTEIIASFADHAPAHTTLVIKHHPLDRGYHDYNRLIRQVAQELRVTGRVLYIHDQHLPTLFEHMSGAVVINSTVGLSALSHGAPVKTCGDAIYDIEGMTFQGSLEDFWNQAPDFRMDRDMFERFRAYLIEQTQINGNFYRGGIKAGPCASITASMRQPQPEYLPWTPVP